MRNIIILFICVSYSLGVFSQRLLPEFQPNSWYDSEQSAFDSSARLNFHSVQRFGDTVSPIKSAYDISQTARLTVVVVFHSSDTLVEHGIWGVVRDGKQFTGLTDKRLLRPNSEYIYPVKRRGIPLINTSMQAFSKVRGSADSNYFVLGEAFLPDSTLSSFSGYIAECLVFDRFLKKREALQIETYLAVKYGITLIASDYISSSGAVLWNYEANKLYSNGIAGIGRDDFFGLEQKQGSSSEEPDLLTIGVGEFSELNSENNYNLNNEDFILLGHDDGGLVFEQVSWSDTLSMLNRKWLIQTTFANNSFPTNVKFRLPENKDSVQIYYLAIDRSGLADFQSNTVEYIAQDSIDSAGYVYFRGIIWNSKDAFTFSYRTVLEEDTDNLDTNNTALKNRQKSNSSDENLGINSSENAQAQPIYTLYPNPTTGYYRLEATFPEVTSVVLRTCTQIGSVLAVRKDAGKTHYFFDGYIDGQGSYLLEIESVYGKKTFKLVVRK